MSPLNRLLRVLPLLLAPMLAAPAAAQAPAFFDLGWEMSGSQTRGVLEARGFRLARGADSTLLYVREAGSLREEISIRLRRGRVWHVYYAATGDSAAVQGVLEAAAAAATRMWGAAGRSGDARAWSMRPRGRFVLPSAPAALPQGGYSLAIVYHRP